MEYHGRRNRRGRPRSRAPNSSIHVVHRPPTCSVYSGFCSFLLMSSLIAIIYLMLDYHCNICSKRCNLYNITKGMDEIAFNISRLRDSYMDIEKTIVKFSQDIPKIEGQINILEALANTMEKGDFVWNPRRHLALPNVDVFLKEPTSVIKRPTIITNVTEKIAKFDTTPED